MEPWVSYTPFLLSLWIAVCAGCLSQGNSNEQPFDDRTPYANIVEIQAGERLCSATLIAPKALLTARHCVEGEDPTMIWVRTADNSSLRVLQAHMPQSVALRGHDIAVLVLETAATIEPRQWLTESEIRIGTELTVVGFAGALVSHPETPVTVVDATPFKVDLAASEMMVGEPELCQGDSGSPALYRGVVAGVVSRGRQDCKGGAILTRVKSHADYVQQILASIR